MKDGTSSDTSMRLTTTGGIIMGNRSGDLDPGALVYWAPATVGDRTDARALAECTGWLKLTAAYSPRSGRDRTALTETKSDIQYPSQSTGR